MPTWRGQDSGPDPAGGPLGSKDCFRRSRRGSMGRIFHLLIPCFECFGLLCGAVLMWDLGEHWRQSSLGLREGLGEDSLAKVLEAHGALTSVLSRSPTCLGVTRRAVTPKHRLLCFLHGSLSNCLCLPKNSKAKLKRFPDGSARDLKSTGCWAAGAAA